VQARKATSDGLELVLERCPERLRDKSRSRPRDADAAQELGRDDMVEFFEKPLRRLRRAPLDAAIPSDQQGTALDEGETVARALEQVWALRQEPGEQVAVVRVADESRLEADAADVDAERSHEASDVYLRKSLWA